MLTADDGGFELLALSAVSSLMVALPHDSNHLTIRLAA
jgi:hypothetical protein